MDNDVAERRSIRAPAMPPDERRAAIIATTLPLLLTHGSGVTTRQIAEAAGIAEGTIFRVFPDKESLIQAVVDAALDPAPAEAAVAAIDRELPFEQQLVVAVGIIQRRIGDIWRLFSVVGHDRPRKRGDKRPTEILELVALFEPQRSHLRCEPGVAAEQLRGLTLALTHPMIISSDPMPADEIVALFLHGIQREI